MKRFFLRQEVLFHNHFLNSNTTLGVHFYNILSCSKISSGNRCRNSVYIFAVNFLTYNKHLQFLLYS